MILSPNHHPQLVQIYQPVEGRPKHSGYGGRERLGKEAVKAFWREVRRIGTVPAMETWKQVGYVLSKCAICAAELPERPSLTVCHCLYGDSCDVLLGWWVDPRRPE